MFGEESMYGQYMVHLDDKDRIFLPRFTYVEQGDSLLIIDKEDYLHVYGEEVFEKRIKQLEDIYIKSSSDKKREIEIELLKLYSSILKKVKADSQRRINLGGIKTNKNEFLCIGARDHIVLDTKKIR